MCLRSVNEKETIVFAKDLLDYYGLMDSGCNTRVLTSKDEEAKRNNVAWYYHDNGFHNIKINVPNLLSLKSAISRGEIDTNAYYAFVAMVVGHEFRHYLQGKCIWDGNEIDDFGQADVINSQLMMYIRFFFDAYYLINKGFVKYEVDAEKFAVKESIKFLKDYFPDMDVEKAIVDAVIHYATIQIMGGTIPTLPNDAYSTDEIVQVLDERIRDNLRVDDLRQTLFVHNPRFFANHLEFGLDETKIYTNELLENYAKEKEGSKKDLVVAKAIISSVERPVESMRDFPALRKAYIEKRL